MICDIAAISAARLRVYVSSSWDFRWVLIARGNSSNASFDPIRFACDKRVSARQNINILVIETKRLFVDAGIKRRPSVFPSLQAARDGEEGRPSTPRPGSQAYVPPPARRRAPAALSDGKKESALFKFKALEFAVQHS